jgi:hypothetical protein
MSYLKKVLITMAITLFLLSVITQLFVFLDIGPEVYGIYVIWALAAVAFYLILPAKQGSIFEV